MNRKFIKVVVAGAAITLIASGCGSSKKAATSAESSTTLANSSASQQGSTSTPSTAGTCTKPLTIGLVTSETGPFAPDFSYSKGAAQARIDLANASGGVDGCKLQLIVGDDGSSPTQVVTAAENLMQKNVDVLATVSYLTGLFADEANRRGFPVVGSGYSGAFWGAPKNTNMFTTWGGLDPSVPGVTTEAQVLKDQGATKLAIVCNSNDTGTNACDGIQNGAKAVGLPLAINDHSIGLTQTSFTSDALKVLQSGASGVAIELPDAQAYAFIVALSQQGYKGKLISSSGYSQTLLNDPSIVQAMQGAIIESYYTPVELNTPATEAFQAALKKYANISGVPSLDAYSAYTAVDLAIAGLAAAGPGASHQKIISALRGLTAWNASGLSTAPIDFATDFGKGPFVKGANGCMYLVVLKGKVFTPLEAKAVCGKEVPS